MQIALVIAANLAAARPDNSRQEIAATTADIIAARLIGSANWNTVNKAWDDAYKAVVANG